MAAHRGLDRSHVYLCAGGFRKRVWDAQPLAAAGLVIPLLTQVMTRWHKHDLACHACFSEQLVHFLFEVSHTAKELELLIQVCLDERSRTV
jgi:hypothetical protein